MLATMAASPGIGRRESSTTNGTSWYEALANAWGNALDNQATRIQDQSELLRDGMDNPSQITLLTAESLRMGFMAQSSSTSTNSVGEALSTMARKN
ncbi:MAG: hypothetical protein WA979_12680 [Pacificimonas sp.]